MKYEDKLARINKICSDARDHFMHFEVLFNKKRKLLLAASFDSTYYWEFFVLLTGLTKDGAGAALRDGHMFRSLRLEPRGELDGVRRTELDDGTSKWDLHHKTLFYFAPKKPLYTGLGIRRGDEAKYPLLDLTVVVDKCLALEDTFPK
jgi:hypothetical protein